MAVDKNMNILIVDDDKAVLQITRNLVAQFGFINVDDAPDGKVALDLLAEKTYGLIISDWNMEPMSGIDLLKTLRTEEGPHQDVPFIMVTAESTTEKVMTAKEAGVNNYIVKPINTEILRKKISAVLGEAI